MYWLGQTMLQISLITYGLIYQVSCGSNKSAGGQVSLQGSCLSWGHSVIQTASISWLHSVRPLQEARSPYLSLKAFVRKWHMSLLLTGTWSKHMASPNWEKSESIVFWVPRRKGETDIDEFVSTALHVSGTTSVPVSYGNERLSRC